MTFFYGGMGVRTKKHDAENAGIALVQTKGAMRLLRSYSDIPSRSTKYALVVIAESLRKKGRDYGPSADAPRGPRSDHPAYSMKIARSIMCIAYACCNVEHR